MISVVTVCVGDYPQGDRYVHALWKGFHRHLGQDFNFYCISDQSTLFYEEIHKVKPVRDVWGWWNLLEIYRPDAEWSQDDVIMVGMDTIIRGDISWILEPTVPTFLKPISDQYGFSSPFNGMVTDGLVYLPAGDHCTWIWDSFVQNVKAEVTHGAKRAFKEHVWVWREMKKRGYKPPLWQDLYPGKICSYKRPSPRIDEPGESLVVFHGSPRPHEAMVQSLWISKYWG